MIHWNVINKALVNHVTLRYLLIENIACYRTSAAIFYVLVSGCHGVYCCVSIAVVAPLSAEGANDTPLIIILTVCIIGLLLLALNILLILYFIRRRKRKLEKGEMSPPRSLLHVPYGTVCFDRHTTKESSIKQRDVKPIWFMRIAIM